MTRQHADWMWQIDERILEYLDRKGPVSLYGLQSRIAFQACDAQLSRAELADRVQLLLQYDMVSRNSLNLVFLTDYGKEYLKGNQDADELRPSPNTGDDRHSAKLENGREERIQ